MSRFCADKKAGNLSRRALRAAKLVTKFNWHRDMQVSLIDPVNTVEMSLYSLLLLQDLAPLDMLIV